MLMEESPSKGIIFSCVFSNVFGFESVAFVEHNLHGPPRIGSRLSLFLDEFHVCCCVFFFYVLHGSNTIVLLGIGTVGSGIIQLLPHFLPETKLVHIVDRVADLRERVDRLIEGSLPHLQERLRQMRLETHIVSLTQQNLELVLSHLFEASAAVMDLTTVVDSEQVARLADKVRDWKSCSDVFFMIAL